MFRYVGLAWDPANLLTTRAARHLAHRLDLNREWQTALAQPGLHVSTVGSRAGSNGARSLHADQGVVLGKLFQRSELGRTPSRELPLGPRETDAIVRSDGRALLRDHWGRYVAFLRDGAGRSCVLRDPSGTLPCFVMHHQGVCIVFSWLEDVLTLWPDVPRPEVDSSRVAAHLVLGEQGGRHTLLQGIRQVLPGELVPLGALAEPGALLWNAFEQARLAPIENVDEAAATLRQTVRACTQAWAGCYEGILLRLSGGVDSSIVLSCLTPADTEARVTCVNYHSPGIAGDERGYARLAAALAHRVLVERARESGFQLETLLHAAPTPMPVMHVGRMGSAAMDAELAAVHGAQALFTGGGGDQLFFEFQQCWPAADYLRLRGLDRGFPAVLLDAARLARVSVWRALRLAVGDSFCQAAPTLTPARPMRLITDAARAHAAQVQGLAHPAWAAATGLPIGKRTQAHQLMYPMGYYDPFERGAAPEQVNPLLSQPLVELCLRLPTWVLAHGGRGRGLARRAFGAVLPPEIAARRSKGGMEDHILTVLLNQVPFVRQLLLEGELVRLGLIDRARTEALLRSAPGELASQASELHVCLSVEAWLRHWRPR